MIHARHPHVAAELLEQLEGHPNSPCLQEAATTARSLVGIMGFELPSWRAVMAGARPPPVQPEEFEPAQRGWQHEAASRVERAHRVTQIFPRMTDAFALVRSHGGPGAGLALLTCPACRLTTIDSHLFRVILLRRLHMPLPPTVRSCRCGRLLDSFGHHRAACARAGFSALEDTLWKAQLHEFAAKREVVSRQRACQGVGPHRDPADERRLEVR